jgi:hypothetical protein
MLRPALLIRDTLELTEETFEIESDGYMPTSEKGGAIELLRRLSWLLLDPRLLGC